ncbi:MAG TPA: tetratricopeptide repeat protein, partial [Chthoniobacteraceae bacterium]
MPNPAETTPTPPVATEFDPLEFWIRHKGKILLYTALLLIALLIWGIFELTQSRARAAAEQAYATATTAEAFQKLIEQHPKSVSAGNAHLRLAALQQSEGKHAEAIATLRQFTERFPEHPLLTGAWVGMGVNQEALEQKDEALA